jgi:hypothetical protein
MTEKDHFKASVISQGNKEHAIFEMKNRMLRGTLKVNELL